MTDYSKKALEENKSCSPISPTVFPTKVYVVVLHFMISYGFIPDRAVCIGSALHTRVSLGKRGGKKEAFSNWHFFLATSELLGTKDPAWLYNCKTGKKFMKVCSHQELRISS